MDVYSKIIVSEPYRQVRLTVNEFREEEYLHLREYYLDFEEDWKPSNKGISIPLDFENSKELFIGLSEILSMAENKQVLEEFFGEIIRDVYTK
jgi:hypothetical protein|tara:strand:- start:17223 stop:17501 length:279 start_codon:yes stop_codon:yes gene_type:complete